MRDPKVRLLKRKQSIRKKITGTKERPRLSVYRGHKHIYAQLIDDTKGNTLLFVSTLSPELKDKMKSCDTVAAAQVIGEALAKKAIEKGYKSVVFDRSGYIYHGRIKALADTARKNGLVF
ncbi:MAG: 50S ribosomal protein L18 [Elusimicrobia bacterium]|nr:50S ribosomal protein L18 [Candidatus Liberimonas magnetica]